MEPPPIARYIPQKSKKRVFPGSSSSYMEPEVVEISPPIAQSSKSKSLKQKEVVLHEVIDIDMDDDSTDVMLIDDKIDRKNKGKETLTTFSNGHSSAANPGSVDGVPSHKNYALGPHDSINVDGFSPDLFCGDDEYLDMYYDDLIDDEYAMLQAHFDSIDIPPGVEAPIPWLSNPAQNKNQPVIASSLTGSSLQVQPDAVMFPSGTCASRPWGVPESAQTKKKSCSINSLRAKIRREVSPSLSLSELAKRKKRLAASICSTHSSSQTQKGSVNTIPPESASGKSWCFTESSRSKKKFAVSGSNSTTRHSLPNQLSTIKLSHGNEQPSGGSYFPNSLSLQVGNGSLTHPSFLPIHTTPGVDTSNSWWQQSPVFPDLSSFYAPSDDVHLFPSVELYTPWVLDPATVAGSSTLPSETVTGDKNHGNASDILKKFQDFKKFDTVEDHSDHHYSRSGSSLKQPSKNWAKKIQEEWKILEKDLPDTIFVRVYESRMDLLRAVIVGAEGTPYHDGLFFFDVFFPCGYPNVPPHVHYHSGGLRINPNLYNCGKVCLSLLNTWTGNQNEKWIPGVSTMLQVLVSIQGLILNAKPYFNEPGYARMSGSARGELSSQQYNENTFILSLKTMVYTMRRPPKHFEDFVVGHFHKHAHDILVACKAYTDGAQVGCLAKGGVQDVDAGDKSCSQNFKGNLAGHINMLVQAFTQIGAKDCEKFISPVEKGNGPAPPAPNAANNHLS